MIAKVIKPDGTIQEVVPASGTTFSYEELRQHVGGGYIEILRMPGTGKAMMVIDEEGKIKQQPYNDVATKLWREGMEHVGSGGTRLSDFDRISDKYPQGDWIVGQVLLCHDDQLEK
jgi:hypothetical protein